MPENYDQPLAILTFEEYSRGITSNIAALQGDTVTETAYARGRANRYAQV